MKRQKCAFRFGVLLLALGLLFASLVGCSNEDTKEPSGTDQAATEPDDGRIKIVSAGVATYTLVYPDNATSSAKSAMEKLISVIADATGVTLETKSDYLKRGALYDSTTPEILFGRTDYSETATALKGLADDQFVIRKVDNKIVIASPQDANLDAAVEKFRELITDETLTANASGKKTLYLSEFTSESTADDGITICGTKLEEYSIVYSDTGGYADIATRLRDVIEAAFDVRLSLYVDSRRDETAAEILVGKTNRSVSQTLYSEKKPKLMTYEIAVREGKVQLLCGGPYSARECTDYMQFILPELKADGDYGVTDLAPNTSVLANGADLRIMTANVLAARWGENYTADPEKAKTIPSVTQRAEIFAAVLAAYQPDVIGIQEGCIKWTEQFPEYLEILKNNYGLEYTWLFSKINGMENMTAIVYRSDKYELLESDTQTNSYWNASSYKYYLRLNAWALLRERANPENKFIIVNTHWAHESAEWLDKSVNEEIALVNSLRTQYNVPIFCTGDFNNKTDTDEYNLFRQNAGVEDLLKQAKANGGLINQCGGCGSVGTVRTGGSYIDHIFGSGDYTALRYETITGNRTQWCSDHSPHIADIKFN